MERLLVLNVVGLTPRLLAHTPRLRAVLEEGAWAPLEPVLPAVTCPVQASFLTGLLPRDHGIVANGWYHRTTGEVRFWLQSNRLVSGEKIWEAARRRDRSFTCANLFWWFNMLTTADYLVTPRPAYPADGRKIPDVYTRPASLRDELVEALGPFPLFRFWGPFADITSTRWIVGAALHVLRTLDPTLTLVYLPHLDYDLQRFGPAHPRAARAAAEVDEAAAPLLAEARATGRTVVILSEYGLEEATGVIFPNRALREAGFLQVHRNATGELLDPGASRAFAVCDHQVAHVYVADPADRPAVRDLLARLPGVAAVWDRAAQRRHGLDHPRGGEFFCLAAPGHWFAYPYWLDPARAPDFAPTVDIHRKPGYDPAELFLAPGLGTRLRLLGLRLRATLGLRTLFAVIPLDPQRVRGTHGRPPRDPESGPLFGLSRPFPLPGRVRATAVKNLLLCLLFPA